ncbi:hypothetical protein ACFWIZ_46225, partial [Streptomyces sp. NPDC127044]
MWKTCAEVRHADGHLSHDRSHQGLTPVRTRSGSIDLRDSTGRTVERIPASYAYDSKVNPRSGDPATTHDVSTELVHDKDGYALKVTLDDSWLHDPRRVFPVTVDPQVT